MVNNVCWALTVVETKTYQNPSKIGTFKQILVKNFCCILFSYQQFVTYFIFNSTTKKGHICWHKYRIQKNDILLLDIVFNQANVPNVEAEFIRQNKETCVVQ